MSEAIFLPLSSRAAKKIPYSSFISTGGLQPVQKTAFA